MSCLVFIIGVKLYQPEKILDMSPISFFCPPPHQHQYSLGFPLGLKRCVFVCAPQARRSTFFSPPEQVFKPPADFKTLTNQYCAVSPQLPINCVCLCVCAHIKWMVFKSMSVCVSGCNCSLNPFDLWAKTMEANVGLRWCSSSVTGGWIVCVCACVCALKRMCAVIRQAGVTEGD